MAEGKESLSFEESVSRIDEIVRALEKGDAPLDKSLALFEEGAKLVGNCGRMLDEAEQKLTLLQKNSFGEPEEREFDDSL